jgi:hypothetical protein
VIKRKNLFGNLIEHLVFNVARYDQKSTDIDTKHYYKHLVRKFHNNLKHYLITQIPKAINNNTIKQ